MSTSSDDSADRSKANKRPSTPAPPSVKFEDLSDGQPEILIEHLGQQYRLRTTRNGRLILNK